jgi:arylsulfatase A
MALTHDPFSPSPDHPDWSVDKFAKDTTYFADMVSYMDKVVGRIADKLDELNIRDNTLILFTGDNGNHRTIYSKLDGRWIQGGKSKMTMAGTHVPFIANWSGTTPPNQVSDDLIDFSDFLPTLVDLAGADIPEDHIIDGKSFYPQLLGKKGNPRDWIYMYYWGRGRNLLQKKECAQTKQWKLYDNGEFFDFIKDPLEEMPIASQNLTKEQAKIKTRLQEVLDNIK